MFDYSDRDIIAADFEGLIRSYQQMNQLPHEMVRMFTKGDKSAHKLWEYWVSYFEHMTELIKAEEP